VDSQRRRARRVAADGLYEILRRLGLHGTPSNR
jgi:hypothetical protein